MKQKLDVKRKESLVQQVKQQGEGKQKNLVGKKIGLLQKRLDVSSF